MLASSLIPGNENAVYRVINGLTRLGANVVHQGNARVHVSGHASAGELLYCYNIVKPRNVMPVHGECAAPGRQRRARGADGRARERDVVLAEDGVVVDLVDGVAEIVGARAVRLRLRRRLERRRDHRGALKDRRILGDEGFISVFVVRRLRRPARSSPAPRSTRAGFAEDDVGLRRR